MALANHCNLLGRAPTASSLQIGNVDGPANGISTDNALARWDGTTGRAIQNGIVTEADDTGTLTGPTYLATTTAIGSAFTNQPSNDIVEVLSANVGDTTQTVTIIGTTTATNTIVVETVTLNGTTAVPTVKTNWGVIVAVKKSAATLGTITVRKKTGAATITAGMTAAVLSVGVNTVSAANQAAYNRTLSTVSDGATTKQIGFKGTDNTDAVIYDSIPLTGATAVLSNSSFRTVTEIYTGDVEAARTETVTTTGSWVLTAGDISLVVTGTNQGFTFTPNGTGAIRTGNGSAASPIYSFTADPDTGLMRDSADQIGVVLGGVGSWHFKANELVASAASSLSCDSTWSFKTAPAAANTHIVLPSASVNTLLGGLAVDGTGVLQFPAATTSAGGITFGTDTNIFRSAAGQVAIGSSGTTTSRLTFIENGSTSGTPYINDALGAFDFFTNGTIRLQSGGVTAITLDGSQNQFHSGAIEVHNGGATGAVTSNTRLIKTVAAIANAVATDVLTVTIPNAAHSASLIVRLNGSLGAGGAIGANEATGTITYNFAITRTAGVAVAVAASAAIGTASTNVAGGATITVTAANSGISGAVGATNTFTVQATISRGSGASTNHTALVVAEVLNSNATGVTIS